MLITNILNKVTNIWSKNSTRRKEPKGRHFIKHKEADKSILRISCVFAQHNFVKALRIAIRF